jgi:Response regulator receiver domain
LGIGLTLVKNIVEMHDGTAEARSAGIGKGSEVVVRLPLLSAPLSPLAPEPSGARPATIARRILVVDDNQDSAESLAMLLKLAGHEVQIAHDGLEAVERAATYQPHTVLLDLGLPKLNGYEVERHRSPRSRRPSSTREPDHLPRPDSRILHG